MIPKPPLHVTELPAGTTLLAGRGFATVLPDFDFETYSEAGYVWGGDKWKTLPNATKKGISVVGAATYSEHHTTEVLSMYYDLKDGTGAQFWRPGMPAPTPWLEYTGLIEAHNTLFEYWIWRNVCTRKYGWPEPELHRFRCSMGKARAWGLPPSLDKIGAVLDIELKKDKEGDRLIKKFCMPRNPSKADPRRGIDPARDEVDGPKLYAYNLRDIQAEAEVSSRIPDLTPVELDFFEADKSINVRGVHMDISAVHDCCAILDAATEQYNSELCALTGGAVARASEVSKLTTWLDIGLTSLDEENLTAALLRGDLTPDQRRALEIRALIGSASVKKVYSIRNRLSSDSRMKSLFTFHGARTGRAISQGCQASNLPNSGPELNQCGSCGSHSVGDFCKWCGDRERSKPVEWNAVAMENVLTVAKTRDLQSMEYFFGDAMKAMAGSLRGLFAAAPGHDMICSDYSAIEAVVLAALAGEEWRMDVFRTHGKIYETSASKITGVSFAEMMKSAGYPNVTDDKWWEFQAQGKHHPLRKTIGKVSELACFAAETQVLTARGYVGIVDVRLTDKLWDGEEWITHRGIVEKGIKTVLDLDGVMTTPNHPISLGHCWKEARLLVSDGSLVRQALAHGSEHLPHPVRNLRMGKIGKSQENSTNSVRVYDILNAGPRHRFTIRTNSGHMIVHNSGYGGWIGAWKAFGADEFMTDPEIKKAILAWRKASPAIVEFWGGQFRGMPWDANRRDELFGLEGMAIAAVMNPGTEYPVRADISYLCTGDVLYCRLPSGRDIAYHQPRLGPSSRGGQSLSFMGYNTNPKMGGMGWTRMETYAGKLTENVVQAVACDILRHAIVQMEAKGYPVVMHIYDEIVSEVPHGFGSVEEFEGIMVDFPDWAKGWPIRAAGGWRGKRYRK